MDVEGRSATDTELVTLRRRVAGLESKLARLETQSRGSGRDGGSWSAAMISAGALAALVALLLAGVRGGPVVSAQGPSTVRAPFNVVDEGGRLLVSIKGDPHGGAIGVFGRDGKPLVVVDGDSRESQGGSVRVLNRLQTRASLGVDRDANGYVVVSNTYGKDMASLSAASDGSGGRVAVSKPEGITVLMGVLTSGKGDVCANGAPGKQVCLSGLALKTLTPY